MDIILTQGYKRSGKPEIEINQPEKQRAFVSPGESIALVND